MQKHIVICRDHSDRCRLEPSWGSILYLSKKQIEDMRKRRYLITLADYVRRLETCRLYLFAFGFLWWTVTAFSRLTVGAH